MVIKNMRTETKIFIEESEDKFEEISQKVEQKDQEIKIEVKL